MKYLLLIAGISLLICGIWLSVISLKLKDSQAKLNVKTIESGIAMKAYENAFKLIEGKRDTIAMLTDSIFGMNTEKGHIEIELNKSEARLNELLKNSKQVRVKKDTVKIVQNCDSIIDEMQGYYLPSENEYRRLQHIIDSLQETRHSKVDTVLDFDYALKTRIINDLRQAKTENYELNKTINKKEKQTIFAGIAGLIAGVLITIIK